MRFIQINTRHRDVVAINADAITTIKKDTTGIVYIYVGADSAVPTQFTNIESAVDYIQRAQSISLTQGVQNESDK
jgi:hypothetical protein